jgi:signal transduction histidine kinase
MKPQRKTTFSPESVPASSRINKLDSIELPSTLQHGSHKVPAKSLPLVEPSRKLRSESRIQELTRCLINTQEEERKRLARELHDDIGQRLAMVKVEIEMTLQESPALRTGAAGARFVAILTEIEQLGVDVQHLSHTQHSSRLRFLGLKAALKELCEQVQKRQPLAIDLRIADMAKPVGKEIELCIYRVAQEALHNIIKHSAADHVVMKLIDAGVLLLLEIRDNGKGFNQSRIYKGVGLVSMHERLAMVGGNLEVRSEPGRGTLLLAKAPFTASPHHSLHL